ncbi:bifunctional folylpolyglutamate synthase/dihydrofolate synthase [bacterium]|nr:bifunctional folylpolyglutamate synthase/dihydrofolate synthase [bacterium]
MTRSTYQSILEKLATLTNYEKNVQVPYQSTSFDLEQFKAFLADLGSPQRDLSTLLIAGTSGKGATGRILTDLLLASGLSVAFYSSPHLVELRERIELNGQMISKNDFCERASRLFQHDHFISRAGKGMRTFFEFMTALAIVYFQEHKPDLAVFEVGVGGRLDATNVFRPRVSIITPIGLDHQHWLGKTKRLIAFEKAGIIHERQPVVCASQPASVLPVIIETCHQKQAPIYLAAQDFKARLKSADLSGSTFSYSEPGCFMKDLRLNLAGPFQIQNAALALKAYSIIQGLHPDSDGEKSVRTALNDIHWPGRLQTLTVHSHSRAHERLLILDGAHNTLAMTRLRQSLKRLIPGRKVALVAGFARDKRIAELLRILTPLVSDWFLTRFDQARAADPHTLAEILEPACSSAVFSQSGQALEQALSSTEHTTPVLVTGSLYLVAEILTLVQGPEYRVNRVSPQTCT